MNGHLRFPNRLLTAGLALLWCVSFGCGTADYEKRLKARVSQIGQESVFAQMHPAQSIPGSPLKVQVPTSFSPSPLGAGGGVDPRRVQMQVLDPADLNLGEMLTFEGFVEDSEGGKTGYYCYVGALNAAEPQAKNLDRLIRGQLQSEFSTGAGRWSAVQCETPEGRATEWQKIDAAGDQEFYYVDKDGKESFRVTGGTVWVFTRREGDYVVLICWRVPTVFERHAGLAQWAPKVAGSVTAD